MGLVWKRKWRSLVSHLIAERPEGVMPSWLKGAGRTRVHDPKCYIYIPQVIHLYTPSDTSIYPPHPMHLSVFIYNIFMSWHEDPHKWLSPKRKDKEGDSPARGQHQNPNHLGLGSHEGSLFGERWRPNKDRGEEHADPYSAPKKTKSRRDFDDYD